MNDKMNSSKEPRSGSNDLAKGGSSPGDIPEDLVPPRLTVLEAKSKGSKTRFGLYLAACLNRGKVNTIKKEPSLNLNIKYQIK